MTERVTLALTGSNMDSGEALKCAAETYKEFAEARYASLERMVRFSLAVRALYLNGVDAPIEHGLVANLESYGYLKRKLLADEEQDTSYRGKVITATSGAPFVITRKGEVAGNLIEPSISDDGSVVYGGIVEPFTGLETIQALDQYRHAMSQWYNKEQALQEAKEQWEATLEDGLTS